MPLGAFRFGRKRRKQDFDRDPYDNYQGDPHDNPPPEQKGGSLFSGVRLFHGPMRFKFFGLPVVVSNGSQIGFMAGFIAILVMIVSTLATFGNLNDAKKDMKFYSSNSSIVSIIDKAKLGTTNYGIVEGRWTGEVVGGGRYVGREYIFEVGDDFYIDSTLGTYRYSSVINTNEIVEIAYRLNPDGTVSSIEMEFDVRSFNAEYKTLKRQVRTYIISAVIMILLLALIVFFIIRSIVKLIIKSRKDEKFQEAKRDAELREAQARAAKAESEADLSKRYCEYCGAKFPEGEDKCPNCGSAHFIIKK